MGWEKTEMLIICCDGFSYVRGVWRYQRGNHNLYNAMAKRKVQKDKQWPTKHTYKTKERVTRTQLKTGVNSGAAEG